MLLQKYKKNGEINYHPKKYLSIKKQHTNVTNFHSNGLHPLCHKNTCTKL